MTASIIILSLLLFALVIGRLLIALPSVSAARRLLEAQRAEDGGWEWQKLLARSGGKVSWLLLHPVKGYAPAGALRRALAAEEEGLTEEAVAELAAKRTEAVRAVLAGVPYRKSLFAVPPPRVERLRRRDAGYFRNGSFSALVAGKKLYVSAFGEREVFEWKVPGAKFIACGFKAQSATVVFAGGREKTVIRLECAKEGAGLVGRISGGEVSAEGTGRLSLAIERGRDGSAWLRFAPVGARPRGGRAEPLGEHPLRRLAYFQRDSTATENAFYALAEELLAVRPVELGSLDLEFSDLLSPISGNPLSCPRRVVRTEERDAARTARLAALLSAFFPIALAVRPEKSAAAAKSALRGEFRGLGDVLVFAGSGERKSAFAARRPRVSPATEFDFRFPAPEFGDAFSRLAAERRRELRRAEKCGDAEMLLLDSLTAARDTARGILLKVASLQLLDGRFVGYYYERIGYLDKNAFEYLLFPIAVAAYLERTGDKTLLSEQVKYAGFYRARSDASAEAGRLTKVFPQDSLYEHVLKCFEAGEFVESGLVTRRRSVFLGLFREVYRNKNGIFALIYCVSLSRFLPYFEGETDRVRYARLLSGLRTRFENIYFTRGSERAMSEEEKLLFSALGAGALLRRNFELSADFTDFYDLFECFAKGGEEKKLPMERVYIYFKGLLLAGKSEKAFAILAEIFKLMRAAGERRFRRYLCFDGERFYFTGENEDKLSALIYADMRLSLFGLKLADDEISLSRVSGALDGGVLTARSRGGSIRLYFKESADGGKRLKMSGVDYAGIGTLSLAKLAGDREGTVEF